MTADDEAPFRGGPSAGSLSAPAALPARAEGSLPQAAPRRPAGWSWAPSLGSPEGQRGVTAGSQAQHLSNSKPSLDWKTQRTQLWSY